MLFKLNCHTKMLKNDLKIEILKEIMIIKEKLTSDQFVQVCVYGNLKLGNKIQYFFMN